MPCGEVCYWQIKNETKNKMSWNLKTLKSVTAYAAYKNVHVEKTGRTYECWNKDNHSVVACSSNLLDLLNDVDDLAKLPKQADLPISHRSRL